MHDHGVQAVLDDLATLPRMGEWVTDAACRGLGDLFTEYPQAHVDRERIAVTCAGCPVRAACAEHALEHGEAGSWAGEWRGRYKFGATAGQAA